MAVRRGGSLGAASRRRRGARSRRAGRAAEWLAVWMLRLKGYRIVARNLVVGRAEADAVALTPDRRTLVIVEVKSAAEAAEDPRERVNVLKRRRLERLAEHLLARGSWGARGGRFDVVVVRWRRWRWPRLRHLAGAWETRGQRP